MQAQCSAGEAGKHDLDEGGNGSLPCERDSASSAAQTGFPSASSTRGAAQISPSSGESRDERLDLRSRRGIEKSQEKRTPGQLVGHPESSSEEVT